MLSPTKAQDLTNTGEEAAVLMLNSGRRSILKELLSYISPVERSVAIQRITRNLQNERSSVSEYRADIALLVDILCFSPDEEAQTCLAEFILSQLEGNDQVDSMSIAELASICSVNQQLIEDILKKIGKDLISTVSSLRDHENAMTPAGHEFVKKYILHNMHHESFSTDDFHEKSILNKLTFLKSLFWKCSIGQQNVSDSILTTLLALTISTYKRVSLASEEVLSAIFAQDQCGNIRLYGLGKETIMCSQIWDAICALLSSSQEQNQILGYRLWYRWVFQKESYSPNNTMLENRKYWANIQNGLRFGFSEHRKFCLNILIQSLKIINRDVTTDVMNLEVKKSEFYIKDYEDYCTVFQTIVLGRYLNQIEGDCLRILTKLAFGESLIQPSWITTLLIASLSPNIAESIRKTIVNWFMEYSLCQNGRYSTYRDFILMSFLPWATQGSVITASIVQQDGIVECKHGERISSLFSHMMQNCETKEDKQSMALEILSWLSARSANMFFYPPLYIMDGLINGLGNERCLDTRHAEHIIQIYNHTTSFEMARDLLTAYSMKLIYLTSDITESEITSIPGINNLQVNWDTLNSSSDDTEDATLTTTDLSSLSTQILESGYRILRGKGLYNACVQVHSILSHVDDHEVEVKDLSMILEALWDELDTQEFPKPSLLKCVQIFLHPRCIKLCLSSESHEAESAKQSIKTLISQVLVQIIKMSRSRIYLLSPFAIGLRNILLSVHGSCEFLPVKDILLSFVSEPPTAKPEFLHEAALSQMLTAVLPNCTYESYYGKSAKYGYACIIDIINRLPSLDPTVSIDTFESMLKPWVNQGDKTTIFKKWKKTLQLQIILILGESPAVSDRISEYIPQLLKVISVETHPTYRYLLEWLVSRFLLKSPDNTYQVIDLLSNENNLTPHVLASMMKLAVIVARFPDTSSDFAEQVMARLVALATSPKIAVRYGAQWSLPLLWEHTEKRGWSHISSNPAFKALNNHIRGLDRYTSPPPSMIVELVDPIEDFNLAHLFEGDFLQKDHPEPELVVLEDFESVLSNSSAAQLLAYPAYMPLGERKYQRKPVEIKAFDQSESNELSGSFQNLAMGPLQTKGSALIAPSLSEAHDKTPDSAVIVAASLISNPHNLGGLSRLSEIYRAQSLILPSLSYIQNKSFSSVSVTSQNHLCISELPPAGLPEFLRQKKREGWTVVGVEQTDKSLVLGREGTLLPKKCVLVMGSEAEGIPSDVLIETDICVEIQQLGVTRSLNVQTAAGMVLFEYWRQHLKDRR